MTVPRRTLGERIHSTLSLHVVWWFVFCCVCSTSNDFTPGISRSCSYQGVDCNGIESSIQSKCGCGCGYVWAGARVRCIIHIMNVRAICCAQVFRTSVMNPTCSSCDCFPCTCRFSGEARASRSGPSRPLEVCYCCTKSLTRPSGRAQSSRVLPSRSGTFLTSVCETCWVHD